MQKRMIFMLALLTGCLLSRAQLVIEKEGILYITDTLAIAGDIQSYSNIQGTGVLLLNGKSIQRLDMRGATVPNLRLDNPAGLSLEGDIHIGNSLQFTNGKVRLNTFNLYLEDGANVWGFDRDRYFVTGQTGELIKSALGNTAFVFPVGSDEARYTPLTLTQNGAVHDIGVSTLPVVWSGGRMGAPIEVGIVNASWQVSDRSPGADNLNIVAGWNEEDELPGFKRTGAAISFYGEHGWDKISNSQGAAAGRNGYSCTRTGVTSPGIFSVGTSAAPAGLTIPVTGSIAKPTIYPNPAGDGFYFHLPVQAAGDPGSVHVPLHQDGMIRLHLLDMQGRIVSIREISSDMALNYYFDLKGNSARITTGEYLLQVIRDRQLIAVEKITVIQ